MTRPSQKTQERHFVESAAKLLGKSWTLGPDRENPDFLVTEGEQRFGLEVSEIFKGRKNSSGSPVKRAESHVDRLINDLRQQYEEIRNIPLIVKFQGNLCSNNRERVVRELVARDFVSEPIGHRVKIDIETGYHARLRLYVTKWFPAHWHSVDNATGWVVFNPMSGIEETIANKSRKLPSYIKAAGPDIRLLIVANRTNNSGKVMLQDRMQVDHCGFQAVYFFSYPDFVQPLD